MVLSDNSGLTLNSALSRLTIGSPEAHLLIRGCVGITSGRSEKLDKAYTALNL